MLSICSITYASDFTLREQAIVCVSEDAYVKYNWFEFRDFNKAAYIFNTMCTSTKEKLPISILDYGRSGSAQVHILNGTNSTGWTSISNINN